ncbi:MAG: hypothetical protein ACE5KX_02940 [Acidimicrobiia bacterium]
MSRVRALSLLLGWALVAAACGSGDGPVAAEETTVATTAPPTPATGAVPTAGEPAAKLADGWTGGILGTGIKPVLALDPSGVPAVAYLFEARGHGFVEYASAADGWTVERITEGYFYGPIGLAFDLSGRPHVVYHDHQADAFQPELGDLASASRGDDGWVTSAAEDDGHDGWDSTIAIGADGVVRAAGVDPEQFDRIDGVEYYELRDGTWQVTAVGSGPIEYSWNVSLAVDPDGRPGLSYYDNNDDALVFALRGDDGWSLEVVATGGGSFSSLGFDMAGRPHISFFQPTGGANGLVRYAVLDAGGWSLEDVGTLEDVQIGHTGARRITSLALEGDVPHIAFSDRGVIRYAIRTPGGWEVEDVAVAGDHPLGQLVSLKLDAGGTPHLAFFEVTEPSPLNGVVVYVTAST